MPESLRPSRPGEAAPNRRSGCVAPHCFAATVTAPSNRVRHYPPGFQVRPDGHGERRTLASFHMAGRGQFPVAAHAYFSIPLLGSHRGSQSEMPGLLERRPSHPAGA